ncbi:MAG TPA: lysophospholipid acyltransferase family protein, partial [Candidatus Binataceae bacterium]|nr:lysophospholipid acyltransferase family protein [Candidatus Binataceae bacterium]
RNPRARSLLRICIRSANVDPPMARQIAGARARLEYTAFAAARRTLASMPLGVAMRTGAALGSLAMTLDRTNRPIAMRNLELAFPQADVAWRLKTLREMYRNWGRVAAEWSHLADVNKGNIGQYAVYEEPEFVEYLRRERFVHGALCLTAHFGNTELMAAANQLYSFPIAIVGRPLRNPLMDDAIESSRARFGSVVIGRRDVGRQILGLLRSSAIVAFALDLDVRKGVFVDFFSHKASTSDGLARLAMATRVPVVPVLIVRQGASSSHRIKVLPLVEIVCDGNQEESMRENTQRFTKVLEDVIRAHPDHWNWIHRRWKTRPPGEPPIY